MDRKIEYVDLNGLQCFAEELKSWLRDRIIEVSMFNELETRIKKLEELGVAPPVVSDLEVSYYHGALDYNIEPSYDINQIILNLNKSNKRSVSTNMNKEYHYLILFKDYKIDKIFTSNNEDITLDFIDKGIVTMNGVEYNLYEFHLDNGLPLDISATINIIDE